MGPNWSVDADVPVAFMLGVARKREGCKSRIPSSTRPRRPMEENT